MRKRNLGFLGDEYPIVGRINRIRKIYGILNLHNPDTA